MRRRKSRRGNWWAVIAVVVIAMAGCSREKSAKVLFEIGVKYDQGQGVAVDKAEAVVLDDAAHKVEAGIHYAPVYMAMFLEYETLPEKMPYEIESSRVKLH